MARPQKNGLDYYPQDTTSDRKWKLFKAKYGLAGIGLLTELFKVIYGEGYFYLWDEEAELLFAAENGIQEDTLKTMISYAIEKGIFDKTIFEKYGLLTSKGIQKRFFEACWKRASVNIFPEIMLIDPKKPEYSRSIIEEKSLADYMIEERSGNDVFSDSETMVSDSETDVLDSETGVSDIIYSQSKVKKSKVKEINRAAQPEPPAESLPAVQSDSKQSKDIAPMKDDLAQMWQEMITRVQPHTSWSNYGKERSQVNQLAKKTRALYEDTLYTDEGQLAKAVFSQFLEMRQTGNDKRIRGTPVIPSRIVQFWPEVVTALAEQYQAAEAAEEYDPEEIIF